MHTGSIPVLASSVFTHFKLIAVSCGLPLENPFCSAIPTMESATKRHPRQREAAAFGQLTGGQTALVSNMAFRLQVRAAAFGYPGAQVETADNELFILNRHFRLAWVSRQMKSWN